MNKELDSKCDLVHMDCGIVFLKKNFVLIDFFSSINLLFGSVLNTMLCIRV